MTAHDSAGVGPFRVNVTGAGPEPWFARPTDEVATFSTLSNLFPNRPV